MRSIAFMKVLESTPERYDRGMQILSRGRINDVYDAIAEIASGPGKVVLDIGCGTGNVSLACASKGASVTGIDINSGMLEVAQGKSDKAGLQEKIRFLELGVAEMKKTFLEGTIDSCVSCLAFSELSDDEQTYALRVAHSLLKPDGIIVIADEVLPGSPGRRFLHGLAQVPFRVMAYLLSQATTRPVKDLTSKLEEAGFIDIQTNRSWGDSFMLVRARRGVQ